MDHLDPVSEFEALIFDCDGTLVATSPVYGRTWATGFRISGKDMPLDWYAPRAGMLEYVLLDDLRIALA
jgi:beta-phosphoglucomutase-like phosphatase (HAD superfamily)